MIGPNEVLLCKQHWAIRAATVSLSRLTLKHGISFTLASPKRNSLLFLFSFSSSSCPSPSPPYSPPHSPSTPPPSPPPLLPPLPSSPYSPPPYSPPLLFLLLLLLLLLLILLLLLLILLLLLLLLLWRFSPFACYLPVIGVSRQLSFYEVRMWYLRPTPNL
jgi:hypothetical protein